MSGDLVIANAEVDGVPGRCVRMADGRIAEIGPSAPRRGEAFDARGGAVIPGLIDHHLHLLATAAASGSLDLSAVRGPADLRARVAAFARGRKPGAWLRAAGYHERMAGLLDRHDLDLIAPAHPLRVQHQSGALWLLNSAALAIVARDSPPACVERDEEGAPTGRIWRGDAWLRARIGGEAPNLAPVGSALAAAGVTAVTDASVSTDAASAGLLGAARRSGALPQRLRLMSGGDLIAPADGAWSVGPVKIMLDEHDLPPLADMAEAIGRARTQGRRVAVHCVTAAELALALAAFEAAGATAGDRLEHGGVIPAAAIPAIAGLGLTVVTQPAFVAERGDRYALEMAPAEHGDLYRCASLMAAGVRVAASSDAPYASADPWSGMRAAVSRMTRDGRELGPGERLTPAAALALYLGRPDDPGGPPRRVEPGADADLVVLRAPLKVALAAPCAELVAATVIAVAVVHQAT